MAEKAIVLLSFSLALIFVLAIALTITIIKLHLIKKNAREIKESLEEILNKDTNALITLSGQDKDMRMLANSLNTQLSLLRKKQLTYLNGDAELKNAMTNASHDLRTPLTAICGYLDLISKEKNPAKRKEYLQIIGERTLALKSLTDELFKYSVTLDKSRNVSLEEVRLDALVKERLLDFYDELDSKGVTPVLELTEVPVKTIADKRDLSRIIDNLLSNALKYGEGNLKVALDDNGVLTISNSASRLTLVDVEKMFDRFYTVKNYNYSTGLGLSIAKSLTEQYGGTICAAIDNGVFSVTLSFPATR